MGTWVIFDGFMCFLEQGVDPRSDVERKNASGAMTDKGSLAARHVQYQGQLQLFCRST